MQSGVNNIRRLNYQDAILNLLNVYNELLQKTTVRTCGDRELPKKKLFVTSYQRCVRTKNKLYILGGFWNLVLNFIFKEKEYDK